MKTLAEITSVPPPYPIYKAYFVPYREDTKLYDSREVSSDDVEAWRDCLKSLKKFLTESLKATWELRGRINKYERLELIADLISLFFRLPLLEEPLPSVAPSPLKIYLLCRLLGWEHACLYAEVKAEVEDPLVFSRSFYEKGAELLERAFKDIIKIIDEVKLRKKVERCWFCLPADTRPVFNTSGLIPHLLVTSALTWSLSAEKEFDRVTAAVARIAALLHDAGKPFNLTDHVIASVEVAKIILSDLLDPEEVKRVVKVIRDHHVCETQLGKLINEADRLASATDRLKGLILLIEDDLKKEAEEAGLKVNIDSWRFWCELARRREGSIKRLSEEFVKRIRERTEEFTKLLRLVEDDPHDNIYVGLVDVGNVQGFVRRSEELRAVAAASLVVDTLVMAQLPMVLQSSLVSHGLWLPYEAFLYTAGGIVEFIVPRTLRDEAKKVVDELSRKSHAIGLPLRFVYIPFDVAYQRVVEQLAEVIQREKLEVRWERREVRHVGGRGVRNLCEMCHLGPHETFVLTPEGKKSVCRTCKHLYELGRELHFAIRYKSGVLIGGKYFIPRDVYRKSWDDIASLIVELIAGHGVKELEKIGVLKRRNLAVLKADGNLMGPFFATSVSLTDIYERSARIDMALKRAIEKAASLVFESVRELTGAEDIAAEATLPLKLGLLYAGGDDILLILPSWVALVVAWVLAKEFLLNVGQARGIAVAIVAGPSKSPVWSLIEAADELMRKAKRKVRSIELVQESSICFDISEPVVLSGSSVNDRFNVLMKEMLSEQPFLVGESRDELQELVQTVCGAAEPKEAVAWAFKLSRVPELAGNLKEEVEKVQNEAKNLRSAIRDTVSAARSMVTSIPQLKDIERYVVSWSLIYAARQAARAAQRAQGEALSYSTVVSLTPKRLGEPSRLADADRLVKLAGGGVL